MLALALLKGTALTELLAETAQRLQGRRWGIGLLGFAPQALLDEQLAESARHKPDFALIAGRPDQAVHLERSGIPTFLHVPSANGLPTFLAKGRAASFSKAGSAVAISGRCRASCCGAR